MLEEIAAPVADVQAPPAGRWHVDPAGLSRRLLPELRIQRWRRHHLPSRSTGLSVAAPFEDLRDRAEAHLDATGSRPAIFLATLGPLAEHTARADFARNLSSLQAGSKRMPPRCRRKASQTSPPHSRLSGCKIAVLCGSDRRYGDAAEAAAKGLKTAGVAALWLAGKFESDSIDRTIFMGCDVVHELTVALAELGIK